MAEKKVIKQIKVEENVYDLGCSVYNLNEISSSTDSEGQVIEYLLFSCGNATELID